MFFNLFYAYTCFQAYASTYSHTILYLRFLDNNKIMIFFLIVAQQLPRILEHPADAVAAREEPLTLNCKAAGRPPPEISWYHNGTPLVPSERRVVLPEGSLFFLRLEQEYLHSICISFILTYFY